ARRGGRIGVDLETVSKRHPGFAAEWFTEGEQNRFGSDDRLMTTAWACKESVLKVLGVGMAIHPRDIEVLNLKQGGAEVFLHNEAGRIFADLGGGNLEFEIVSTEERVLVMARLAA
ncbi:MAG: 4'-phosphopantetheinyl transferase superfamily protein, partial [Myxococcota bacterium]|nr:4'-phosphopantetheinyl transferase superfamily protein [Myxococcota bacterium]